MNNCDLRVHVRDALDLSEDASNEALVEATNTLYANYRDIKDELGVPYWADHNEVVDEIRSLTSSRAGALSTELCEALGLSPGASQDEVRERIRDHNQTRRLARMEQDSTREANGRLVDMLGAVVQALGLHDKADLNEVLAHIRTIQNHEAVLRTTVRAVKEALGLKEYAGHNDVLDHIKSLQGGGATEKLRADVRSLTQFLDNALEEAAEQHKDLCQVLGMDQGRTRQDILDRIRSERQALVGAGVLHVELCEALGLDPEASDQQIINQTLLATNEVEGLRDLLHRVEKDQASWRQKACHLQEAVDHIKEVTGLDPEVTEQQAGDEIRDLLSSVETARDSWRQEAIHLQGSSRAPRRSSTTDRDQGLAGVESLGQGLARRAV